MNTNFWLENLMVRDYLGKRSNDRVIILKTDLKGHVTWAPRHHDMVHPQRADEGGLQIWRVSTKIYDKKLGTANC
jgi:hypothetical protein